MKCKVCKSSGVLLLGRIRNSNCDALYCRACDTVFPSVFPSEAELVSYYSGFTANHQGGSLLREQTAKYYAKKKSKAVLSKVRQYSTVEHILDFGGGSGYFARGFQMNGASVTLYDIDDKSKQVARQRGIKTIDQINDKECYDMVFTSHVIEHYSDLHLFIELTTSLLRPGGLLVICCPNKNANEFYRPLHFRKYQNRIEHDPNFKLATEKWFCLDPPRHLYAISEGTIRALAKKHGLELVSFFTEYSRCSNFHSGDLPFPFLIKSFLKDWKRFSEVMLTVVFSRLMKLTGGRKGDSLVALIRKPE